MRGMVSQAPVGVQRKVIIHFQPIFSLSLGSQLIYHSAIIYSQIPNYCHHFLNAHLCITQYKFSKNSNYSMNLSNKSRFNPQKKYIETPHNLDQLRNQFIKHCAVLIQSRFRAFIQRKRYRQFLPIYRRLRQLLLAVSEGWKTRKILKLQSIKAQISAIKDKTTKNQVNLARMSKRELVDEIQRLKRKGRWIEEHRRGRMMRKKMQNEESKENCSLFGNVKAVCIRNVFKQDLATKKSIGPKEQTKGNLTKQDSAQEIMAQAFKKKTDFGAESTRQESFDQTAITPKENFYSLFQQRLKQQMKALTQPKFSKYLKKPTNLPLKTIHHQQKVQRQEKLQPSNRKQVSDRKNENLAQSKKESIKMLSLNLNQTQLTKSENSQQSIQSNRSTNRPKKLKLTLTKRQLKTQQLTSQRQANSESIELSSFSMLHSKRSGDLFKSRMQDLEQIEQSLLFGYRQHYLKRVMSVEKKSSKPLGGLFEVYSRASKGISKGYQL